MSPNSVHNPRHRKVHERPGNTQSISKLQSSKRKHGHIDFESESPRRSERSNKKNNEGNESQPIIETSECTPDTMLECRSYPPLHSTPHQTGIRQESNPRLRKMRTFQLAPVLDFLEAVKSRYLQSRDDYHFLAAARIRAALNPDEYVQPRKKLTAAQSQQLETVRGFLGIAIEGFGVRMLTGFAERRKLLGHIMFFIRSLFEGDVDVYLNHQLEGKRVRTHFEYIIRRGEKAVCLALSDDVDCEGAARGMLGCEIAAETLNVKRVYGIATDFVRWDIWESREDGCAHEANLMLERRSNVPAKRALRSIVEKMVAMLS